MVYDVVGVTIWTDDLDKLRRFYRDILHLPVHSDHGDFLAFAWRDLRLNIGSHQLVNGPTSDPHRVMINFGVNDIQEEYLRLISEGVQFIRKPEQEKWGGWVATFKDPDQNILQLLQFVNPQDV